MNGTLRKISMSKQFKRDIKKYHLELVSEEWVEVFRNLIKGLSLPVKYRNHKLKNDWQDCYECHIKSDILLIYSITEENILQLIRLGSHSDLF